MEGGEGMMGERLVLGWPEDGLLWVGVWVGGWVVGE